MGVVYKSIFKDELSSFMKTFALSLPSDKTYKGYQSTLTDFDSFLYSEGIEEKKLDAEPIRRWLEGSNTHISTKKSKLSRIKRFAVYLSTLGISAKLPELPRKTTEFIPYVFSADEMTRIFDTADDLILTHPNSRIAAEFPMILRILYGCGLRLGEAILLTWDDIDLETGVITVKRAKNKKQRLVPIGGELTRILKLYRAAPCFEMKEHDYLFRTENGQPRTNGAYWSVFGRILCELGIKNPQTAKYGSRGPCIHSLRHTFTFQSFLKAEKEGRGFMETIPFLSTYLGHDGLMHTDIYLRARHELYAESHAVIADYTRDVFPEEV